MHTNIVTPAVFDFIKSYKYRPHLKHKIRRAFQGLVRDIAASHRQPMRMRLAGDEEWTTYNPFWHECVVMESGLKHIIYNLGKDFNEPDLSELIAQVDQLTGWMNKQKEARGNLGPVFCIEDLIH